MNSAHFGILSLQTHSREIYHTKRMQRLTSVAWSLDNKYILSGSDEMNVRIWKAKAWEKLGVLQRRERTAFEYNEVLKSKFSAHPQLARIRRHRQVPKHVYNAKKELRAATQKIMRKYVVIIVFLFPRVIDFIYLLDTVFLGRRTGGSIRNLEPCLSYPNNKGILYARSEKMSIYKLFNSMDD